MGSRAGTCSLVLGLVALVAIASTAARVEAQPQQPYVMPPPHGPAPQPHYVQPQPYYAQPPYAPQPRREPGRARPNLGLIISGAVLLGVGWVLNIATGLPAGDDPFRSAAEPEWEAFRLSSLIPLAGPWVQLAVKPTAIGQDYWAPWLIIDGALQAVGATLLIIAAAMPRDETMVAGGGGGVELALAPSVGRDRLGLLLAGRF